MGKSKEKVQCGNISFGITGPYLDIGVREERLKRTIPLSIGKSLSSC